MQGDEFLGFACHDVTQMDSHLFAGAMGKRNGEDKAMFLSELGLEVSGLNRIIKEG